MRSTTALKRKRDNHHDVSLHPSVAHNAFVANIVSHPLNSFSSFPP